MRWTAGVMTAVLALFGAACSGDGAEPEVTPAPAAGVAGLTVTSSSFVEDGSVPVEHTCDGADTLPPLSWSDPPAEASSLVLVVDDPDAPDAPFTHLAVAGLSPEPRELEGELPADAIVGTNDFGDRGWAGPCPPPDDAPHRYRFTVTALSEELDLEPGFSPDELAGAAEGKTVAQGTLTATYGR